MTEVVCLPLPSPSLANFQFNRRQIAVLKTGFGSPYSANNAAKPTPTTATAETANFPAPLLAAFVDDEPLAVDVEVPPVVAGFVAWT